MSHKNKKFYALMDDLMGLEILGNPKNIEYTKSFIHSVSNFTYEDLEGMKITNKVLLNRNNINSKKLESDIKGKLANKTRIIIEIQNKNDIKTEIKNICYGMNELVTQLKRGDKDYSKVDPVYQIIVVKNNTLRKKLESKLITTCQIRDENNKEYILLKDNNKDYYTVKIVDINCEIDYSNSSEELISWIKLFRVTSFKELREISKLNELTKSVSKEMEEFMNYKWVRTLKEKLEDNIRIEREEAREEGIELGRNKEKQEMIKNMLNYNMNPKEISKITGIPYDKIISLK